MEGFGKRVLVADDDHHVRFLVGSLLEHAGYTVVPACDGMAALNELRRQSFDVVITDFHMPLLNGMELAKRVRTSFPLLPVILISATIPEELFGAECRPFACVRKPYDSLRLLEVVRSATEARRPACRHAPANAGDDRRRTTDVA